MNQRTILILLIFSTFLFSCKSIDKSKPEEVVKAYTQSIINNDSKSCYDLISTKSKETVTYDEFKKVFDGNDSSGNKMVRVDNIQEQEKDFNYPTFRRFKISTTSLLEGDTIKEVFYYTLINENNEWKKVYDATLLIVAYEKYRKGDYEGAINLCNKAIELNPFDGFAFEKLAWCYNNSDKINNSSTREETLDKITSSLKHAMSLEPDIASHYNAMSLYYYKVNNPDLAIEYLQKGLNLSENKSDKSMFLANIGLGYSIKNDLTTAKKYFSDALQIEPKYDFALYNLGNIYNKQGDFVEAIKYFERVDKDTKLADNLKAIYYSSYAQALKNVNDKQNAKEYILKALELAPSNEYYNALYKSLK